LERIPEGKDWADEHKNLLEKIQRPAPRTDEEKNADKDLLDQLKKLGVELPSRSP